MKTILSPVTHDLDTVSAAALRDAAALIDREEMRYATQIEETAAAILALPGGCRFVMLCGPSSVGKTTTARLLCAAIERRGVSAFTVSLDDFYRGAGLAPLLENGAYDYESPEAMDLYRLHRCMRELATDRHTRLPRYDFTAGKPSEETTRLHVPGDAVVIFEGINAFSPSVNAAFDAVEVRPYRVFINTVGRFAKNGERVLSRRDVRLCRRLLRDERTRNSPFEHTVAMWPQVTAGEERYIFPYADTADAVIDTTMAYEPLMLAPLLLPRLHSSDNAACRQTAQKLEAIAATGAPLSLSLLPEDSIVCEFVGYDA